MYPTTQDLVETYLAILNYQYNRTPENEQKAREAIINFLLKFKHVIDDYLKQHLLLDIDRASDDTIYNIIEERGLWSEITNIAGAFSSDFIRIDEYALARAILKEIQKQYQENLYPQMYNLEEILDYYQVLNEPSLRYMDISDLIKLFDSIIHLAHETGDLLELAGIDLEEARRDAESIFKRTRK